MQASLGIGMLTSLTSRGMPLLPELPSWLRRAPVSIAERGKPAKKSSSKPLCVARAIAMSLLVSRVRCC